MKFVLLSRSATWFLLSACCALTLNAAEIQLQREVQSRGSLVRLGDVATIQSDDVQLAQRLTAAELFLAPPTDGWFELDRRDLLELLEIRGFDPLDFRLTGARRSTVYGPRSIVPNPEPAALPASANEATSLPMPAPHKTMRTASQPVRPVDPQTLAAANSRLTGAIADYLRRQTAGNFAWSIAPNIVAADAELLSSGGLEISGGQAPFTGSQSFGVRVHRADGIKQRTVEVEVTLPTKVVAVSRNMSAGDVIGQGDLQRIVPTATLANRKTIALVEEVVGMELVRGVVAGQPLEADMLQKPILVRRNAVAQLNVRAGGVVVGTKVRAMDDGAQGDAIRVQSLLDRQQYTVTVTGPQQVEMLAVGAGG